MSGARWRAGLGSSTGRRWWAAGGRAGGGCSLEVRAGVGVLGGRATAAALAGRGGMLSVRLPLAAVEPRLGDELSVAATNGPSQVVVSGPPGPLERLRDVFE